MTGLSLRLLLLCLLALGTTAVKARPVLMISLDGVRPDFVTHADARGLKLPHLRKFVAEGTYAEGVTGVMPTVTYPSHTTLVTGVTPAEHGIHTNRAFDPLAQNHDGWNWYASDVRVPTLWQAADEAGLVTASVCWPVTVGAPGVRYLIPEYWRAGTPEDIKVLRALSRPDHLVSSLEARCGPLLGCGLDTRETDENHTRFAVEILRTKRPGFMTVHLTCFDGIAHEHGPFSAEAFQALEALDGLVGRLREAALAGDPAAVVVIVSDHGFVPTAKRFNGKVAFVEAGLLPAPGAPAADWQATIWSGAGCCAVMLKNPGDETVREKVRGLLARLQADPANGIARVLDAAGVRASGGFPDASFILELQPGWMYGAATSGPLITDAPGTGTHGYFPDRPEMRACFFALGEGIAAGRDLGVVDMRQIAPTVAALLGVKLPAARQPVLDVAAR